MIQVFKVKVLKRFKVRDCGFVILEEVFESGYKDEISWSFHRYDVITKPTLLSNIIYRRSEC